MNNDDSINTIIKLRQVVNTVTQFTHVDACIDFMTHVQDEKIFMICSGALGQTTIPLVHDMAQVNCIYIFCKHKARHEQWAKEWPKVIGIHTDITSICEALKKAAQDCDHNSVSISFVKTTDEALEKNLDTLDCSLMYTQILKEILLTIDFEQSHINEFLTYCRELFAGNSAELKNVGKIEKEYRRHQPIWWYTYNCFLYSMLNRALRLMEVDLIIKLGFFVRDLHNHIAILHSEQYGGHQHSNSLTVYRGQGLSRTDFEQLKQTQDGLLAFNNFLSTSHNHKVSLDFARRTIATSDLVGVLFIMKVNPSITATPFANVRKVSCYQNEEEILFSMHSIFRIRQVKQIDNNDRLWQVDLTLTSDNDPQLHAITQSMRDETFSIFKGWHKLGKLMIRLGHFTKAKELYEILLKQTSNEDEKAHLFHQLGLANDGQGKYEEALIFYENSITIKQNILPIHSDLATSYNNIGAVYCKMGEYSKALSYYEKVLEIYQKTLPANDPDFAASYNHIAVVYINMGEYSKAISYSEKALEIQQKTLPTSHPDFATSYNNIGLLYDNMGEYSKALSFYEKALEIFEKTLPPNHPDFATSYNNIGHMYQNMGEYSKSLLFYEKALEIFEKPLAPNYSALATFYNNIGLVYEKLGEHSKAFSYYEKALEIWQKTLPPNHPSLAALYNNIGLVYNELGEYSKALSFHEKALEIRQKTLSENHPNLADSYNNIGWNYRNMGDYSKALSSHEKAYEIYQKTLPPNHPNLAISYGNMGKVLEKIGNYQKALSYHERTLGIFRKILPDNHPHFAVCYKDIGSVYNSMNDYSKALTYFERAIDIWQRSLPPNHPDLQSVREHIEIIKKKL